MCVPQQYDRSVQAAAAGGAPVVRKKPGRKPKRKVAIAAAAAAAAAAAERAAAEAAERARAAASGEGAGQAAAAQPRPLGPPPVLQMAFRRAEPKALAEGLVGAVKALAEADDVDERLARRWL